MHTQEPARPAIRIGVLDHERLTDGRVLDRPRSVTIGRGVGNTLKVKAPDCPRHFPLIERELGRSWLNFTDRMHGYVFLGREGTPFTLDELATVAEHHHGRNRVELPPGSSARIEFGELAVVLDVETPPAPRAAATRFAIGFTALGLAMLALLGLPRLLARDARPLAPVAAAPAARTNLMLPPLYITVPGARPLVDDWGVPAALARDDGNGSWRAGSQPPAIEVAGARTGRRAGERDAGRASWFADGTLDAQVITEEIERRKGVIVEAYDRALKFSPELRGRVVVRFRVDGDGRMRDLAIVHDTLRSPPVEARILSAMPTWRMPAPADGNAVFYFPFTFRPILEMPPLAL
jgi:hypothetical protein